MVHSGPHFDGLGFDDDGAYSRKKDFATMWKNVGIQSLIHKGTVDNRYLDYLAHQRN